MSARFLWLAIVAVCCAALAGVWPARAAAAVIQGRVVDDQGRPVAGAVVSAYDSANVRRPADFASPPTGSDGAYRLVVPPGVYWLVATVRRAGGSAGPLQFGDRHSGDPVRLKVQAAAVKERDFTVLDLRSAARRYAKKNEDLVTVTGQIVDGQGRPVAGAYVLADRRPQIRDFPQYLSGWTGTDGRFVLYLRPDTYRLAASLAWPPPPGTALPVVLDCRSPQSDLRLPLTDPAGPASAPSAPSGQAIPGQGS